MTDTMTPTTTRRATAVSTALGAAAALGRLWSDPSTVLAHVWAARNEAHNQAARKREYEAHLEGLGDLVVHAYHLNPDFRQALQTEVETYVDGYDVERVTSDDVLDILQRYGYVDSDEAAEIAERVLGDSDYLLTERDVENMLEDFKYDYTRELKDELTYNDDVIERLVVQQASVTTALLESRISNLEGLLVGVATGINALLTKTDGQQ